MTSSIGSSPSSSTSMYNIYESNRESTILTFDDYVESLKTRCPNYLKELPEEELPMVQRFTDALLNSLRAHPTLNKEQAKKSAETLKEGLKDLTAQHEHLRSEIIKLLPEDNKIMGLCPLWMYTQDPHVIEVLKKMEQDLDSVPKIIQVLENAVRFQENPEQPLSNDIKYPVFEMSSCINETL